MANFYIFLLQFNKEEKNKKIASFTYRWVKTLQPTKLAGDNLLDKNVPTIPFTGIKNFERKVCEVMINQKVYSAFKIFL